MTKSVISKNIDIITKFVFLTFFLMISLGVLSLYPDCLNAYNPFGFFYPSYQPPYQTAPLTRLPWSNNPSSFALPAYINTQPPFFNYNTYPYTPFSPPFNLPNTGLAPYGLSYGYFPYQVGFSSPAYRSYSEPLYGSSWFTNLFLLPDPQWRAGQEVNVTGMAPQPVSIPATGVDTAELRIGPPASQTLGVNYNPVIPGYVNRQLIVMFRPEVPPQERARILGMNNCSEIKTSQHAGFTLVALPTFLSVRNAQELFMSEPAVLYAEPNYYRHAHLIPNDLYYRYQWHLPHMSVGSAWDLATGTGAVVALLDSGVAYRTAAPYAKAPDLAGTSILPGWDFVNSDAFPDDDAGHGTHMCGCIAQTTNNFIGVAGEAFSCTVLAIKVMDNTGNVTIADESDGIYYAVNNGAHIINMSLGGPGISVTEQTAVTFAYSQGVTLFGSSGNAGSTVLEYPASYAECISVGAVQYDRTRPAYSNYGTALDLVTPGGNITLDQNLDGYADGILQQTHDGTNFTIFYYYFMEGTSPSCALASGAAALVLSKATTTLTPLNVRNILQNTALDLGIVGWDQEYGWGEINAYQALLSTP